MSQGRGGEGGRTEIKGSRLSSSGSLLQMNSGKILKVAK